MSVHVGVRYGPSTARIAATPDLTNTNKGRHVFVPRRRPRQVNSQLRAGYRMNIRAATSAIRLCPVVGSAAVEPDRPRLVGRRRSTAMPQSLGADDLFGVRSPCGFLTERRGRCVIDERGRALVEVGPRHVWRCQRPCHAAADVPLLADEQVETARARMPRQLAWLAPRPGANTTAGTAGCRTLVSGRTS
jgi:hypothetical protein